MVQWASRGGTAVIFGDPASNWKVLGLTREVEKAEDKGDSDEDRILIRSDIAAMPRWLEYS